VKIELQEAETTEAERKLKSIAEVRKEEI